MTEYAQRRETGPWFSAGTLLDGEEVFRRLGSDRTSEAWLRPYCVYLHVPFCTTICRYCALYTRAIPRDAAPVLDEYVEIVSRALACHPWNGHPHSPTTVHFGGGTPLSIGLSRFATLVGSVKQAFVPSLGCEWAVETTLSSLDDAAVELLASLGFRRIHLGIQTLDDATRRRIGRRETSAGAIRLIRELVDRGFFPSADLIIGLDGAGRDVVESDLRRLHDAGIRMFSVCELRDRAPRPSRRRQDESREQRNRGLWATIWEFMAEVGLQQIHLGQFGRGQADNLYYTHPARGENCVALGAYAHGSAGDMHYGNHLLGEYVAAIRSGRSPIAHGVLYGAAERPILELERGLFTNRIDGALLDAVSTAYPDAFPRVRDAWIAEGLLVESKSRVGYALSQSGSWFVGNMVEDGRAIRRPSGVKRGDENAHRMTRHGAFLVPVLDRWLLFLPLQSVAAVVNSAAARDLKRGGAVLASGALEDLGLLVRQAPSNAPAPRDGDVCPSLLGIIPTRGCNLACGYCDFGGPTAEHTRMDPAIGVAAVDWTIQRLGQAGSREFRLHFFGGEPFLAPEVVAMVVHRARYLADRYGIVPYVDASTNGVFNDSVCDFIGDYFSGIAVSLDGPAEIHNRLRSRSGGQPTFDRVSRTAARLSERPVELGLRTCVTGESVEELEQIVRWMIETYKPSVVNLETMTSGRESERAGLRPPDPYRFAARCLNAYRVADDTGVPVVYSAAERHRPRLSFCPVGTDALIVSPEGRVSACYLQAADWEVRGLDLDLGRVEAGGRVRIARDALERARALPLLKPRCRRCFCQWTCAGGCHVNETYPGCDVAYTPFCVQTRLITAGLLLRDAGCGDIADALVADRQAMERLAHHGWDPFDTVGDERVTGLAVAEARRVHGERGAVRLGTPA